MRTIDIHQATSRELDYLSAKSLGMALRYPRWATDEEAAVRQVPFTMYEVVQTNRDGWLTHHISEVTVTRFGILPDCFSPSISFTDSNGHQALGSVSMFHFDRGEAEVEVQGMSRGCFDEDWRPTKDWNQAGPLIEKEGISVGPFEVDGCPQDPGKLWYARVRGRILLAFGSTPTEAVTRAFCLARMGDVQRVPEDLE